MARRLGLLARCLLAAALAHPLVHFTVSPGSPMLGFPVHSDDFNNLSTTAFAWHWPAVRPVSQLLLEALSALGGVPFYLALNGLTVLYVGLVIAFVGRLLGSRPAFPAWLACALACFALEGAVQQYRYTGMITNLSAGVLGAGALFILWTAFEDARSSPWRVAAGCALALLALLAKEDQLLPALVLCAFAGFVERDPAFRRRGRIALAALVAAGLSFAAYSVWLAPNPFLGRGAVHHRVDLNPLVVARTVGRFLTASPGATFATLCFVVALVLALVPREPTRARRALLVGALVLALVGPYSLLPERVYDYYATNWVPWQLALLTAVALTHRAAAHRPGRATAALFGVAAVMFAVSGPGRARLSGWYDVEAGRSRMTLSVLEGLRPALAGAPSVGVAGVFFRNPWRATDGRYLANRLDLAPRWTVFTTGEYQHSLTVFGIPLERGLVAERLPAELPRLGEMPLVVLRPDGTATVGRTVRLRGEPEPRVDAALGCGSGGRTLVRWLAPPAPVTIHERSPRERVLGSGFGSGSLEADGVGADSVLTVEGGGGRDPGAVLALTIVERAPACP